MRRLLAVLALVGAIGLAACSPGDSNGSPGTDESPELQSGAPAISPAS